MQYYSCWPTVSKGSLNIFNSIYNLHDNQSKYLFYNYFENDLGRANYLVTNTIPNYYTDTLSVTMSQPSDNRG